MNTIYRLFLRSRTQMTTMTIVMTAKMRRPPIPAAIAAINTTFVSSPPVQAHSINVIYTTVCSAVHSTILNLRRRKTIIMNWLRYGHSRQGDDQPTCRSCWLTRTVKHTLEDCPNLLTLLNKLIFTIVSISLPSVTFKYDFRAHDTCICITLC